MDCTVQDHPGLYGVGIRSGFYILWFAVLLSAWLTPRDTAVVRSVLLLYILATFLALIIQVNNLSNVEVYVLLLLTYSTYYAALPLWLWHLVTGLSPYWDPAQWPRVAISRASFLLDITTQLAMTIFQLWWWITGITGTGASLSPAGCTPHAFLFAAVPLANQLFIALNVTLLLILLLGRVLGLCFDVGVLRHPKWLRRKLRKARKRGIRDERRAGLQLLDGVVRASVAAVVLAAVEMTLQWNIFVTTDSGKSVNDASTSAQLIPLMVASGLVVRIVWRALIQSREGDDSDGEEVVITEEYVREEVG